LGRLNWLPRRRRFLAAESTRHRASLLYPGELRPGKTEYTLSQVDLLERLSGEPSLVSLQLLFVLVLQSWYFVQKRIITDLFKQEISNVSA
jgi:hypothetical protein